MRGDRSLPVRQREIIVLRDIEGFSYHEIATVLNCPAGTVMSRLGRARGKLRERTFRQTESSQKIRMTNCEEIRERLTLYLDNELQGDERALVEAHVESCNSCASFVEKELTFLNTVRKSGPLHVASPELKEKVSEILSGSKEPVVRESSLAAEMDAAGCSGIAGFTVAGCRLAHCSPGRPSQKQRTFSVCDEGGRESFKAHPRAVAAGG